MRGPVDGRKLRLFTVYMDSMSGNIGIDQHDPSCHPPTIIVKLLGGIIERYEKVLSQAVILASDDQGLTRE